MTLRSPTVVAVDLFCGVGGLTHGLIRGGVDVRAGVDLDPACRYPYEANNSSTFVHADVSDLASEDIERYFDGGCPRLLAGCAPCQPFSTYSRSGRSRKRPRDWQLVAKFGQLVKEMKPELVTMENVPQLADHAVFREFLMALRGYEVSWEVIDCASIGVPQTRRRLVLVASRLGPLDFDLSSRKTDGATVRSAIAGLPPLCAGAKDQSDPLHTAPRLSPLNLKRIRASRPGGTWRDWDSSLLAECHRKTTGSTYPSVYGRMEWDKASPTITTQAYGYGNGRFGHPEQDRAISLREAAMLQTFPRSYAFVPQGDEVRFNRLGRLIGNAVPVRLGEAIAECIHRHVVGHLTEGSNGAAPVTSSSG